MLTIKSFLTYLFILFATFSMNIAKAEQSNPFCHPFYLGVTSGYGSTKWEGLVPKGSNQNVAMSMSTPSYANEGGIIWGFFGGYELTPFFALEAAYTRYPTARVYFDPSSVFAFDHNGQTEFNTHTQSASVMGKIMLVIPRTLIRAYSGAGAAEIHRNDMLNNHWHLSPTFSVGLNYNFNTHIMAELGANYTAGYGEAEISPSDDYVPFLYSVFVRLAYRF